MVLTDEQYLRTPFYGVDKQHKQYSKTKATPE